MQGLKKYIKNGETWIIILIVYILCWYFISEKSEFKWGDFGSILGAITGLIAFIGVLYTSKQNKQQYLNSEERSTFFELLKIFVSYRDSLRVKRIDWNYDEKFCKWDIIPYNELCSPERTYQQIHFELYNIFYKEIRYSIPTYFSKEEFLKKINSSNLSIGYLNNLATAIDYIYEDYKWSKSGGVVTQLPISLNVYDYICSFAIKIYFEQNNFKPITEAISRTADICFSQYINQVGTYFRNAYYILEMVSGFGCPKRYSDIFRAQLSKDELVLLFFNSFSSLSTPKTRQLYFEADLFNNLELSDVRLKNRTDNEFISPMEYMTFPLIQNEIIKKEYISQKLLKELYNSMIIRE